MYISKCYVCFYAHLFGRKVSLALAYTDIDVIQKGSGIGSIGIKIKLNSGTEYDFGGFFSRDKTLEWLLKNWKVENPNKVSAATINSTSSTEHLPVSGGNNAVGVASTVGNSEPENEEQYAKFISTITEFPPSPVDKPFLGTAADSIFVCLCLFICLCVYLFFRVCLFFCLLNLFLT
jgi:hypothetical protein